MDLAMFVDKSKAQAVLFFYDGHLFKKTTSPTEDAVKPLRKDNSV